MSLKLAPNQALLKNVRLSYPALFQPKVVVDKKTGKASDPKYSACFLLSKEKNKSCIEKIKAAIAHVMKEKWQGQVVVEQLKHKGLRDGLEKNDKDGYGPEVMFVNASTEKRPQVVHRDPTVPLTAQDNVIYAGCRVNAVVSFYAYQNDFGKGIGVNLLTVQFYGDDEPFGETVEASQVFENEEETEGTQDPLG